MTCARCPAPRAFWRQWEDADGDHEEPLCSKCWAVVADDTLGVEVRFAIAGDNLEAAYAVTEGRP